jgi:hypothetical protein
MIISCDIDGVISAAPEQMQTILEGLRNDGHYIAIISACENDPSPSGNTWQSKYEFLTSVGVTAWDELVTVTGDIPKMKAQWNSDHAVQIFIDNNVQNAKASVKAGIPLVLVPWESKQK